MGKISEKIEYMTLEELIPYHNNARLHTEEQVKLIASSIKEYGFINPIIIDKDKVIVAGHGRYEAAKLLGLKKVPVLSIDELTPAQLKAYRLIDNRLVELGSWDKEKLEMELAELDEQNYEMIFDFDFEHPFVTGKIEDDEVPEVNKDEVVIKEGDLVELGEHRVLCGDATKPDDAKKVMGEEKADMVFTDPPYGVSYVEKNKFFNKLDESSRVEREIKNDNLFIENLKPFLVSAFKNIRSIMGEYCAYYITAPQGGDLLLTYLLAMKEAEMPLRHMIIWNKNGHVLSRTDYHYKHEPILYGWGKRHRFYKKGYFTKSVWDIPKPQKSELHPTMKPVELIENAILNPTLEGAIVADFFGGSGSTLIACVKTHRKARLIELDPYYIQVIVERYVQFTGETEIVINGQEVNWEEYKKENGKVSDK